MFLTEAMMGTVFFFSVVTCFLGSTFSFVWLTHRVFSGWLSLKERELELKKHESEARLEQARIHGSIPVWVDREDPMEVAAWNRAVAETWRITARQALEGRTRRLD